MIISRTKKPFEFKLKIFFLVLKGLYFRHTKQTSKNIADTTFKACVCRYFSFFFHQMTALKWLQKICFLFHLKSSFHCQDIQIFVFPSSTLLLPVSHWLKGWWKINLKVYDLSNCLNKNLTHFFKHFEMEKHWTLSTDRVLRNIFMEK